jgi:hypothetical protein
MEVKTRFLITHLPPPAHAFPRKVFLKPRTSARASRKAADRHRPALLFARCLQAMVEVGGSIPRQHLRFIGLAVTFHELDLFGAPFFRGVTEFRSDTIWINKLLSEARPDEYECRDKN